MTVFWKDTRKGLAFSLGMAGLITGVIFMLVMVASPSHAATLAIAGFNCQKSDKDNGGFVLDCDPTGSMPSPSSSPPSTSPIATATPSLSPTAPPSVTASPSPTSTGTQRNCIVNPAVCGFPNADSTGPSGMLGVVSGDQVYTSANQIVANREIRGCVEVRAAGVTFRNVRITGSCFVVVRVISGSVSIEDSEISCQDTGGSSALSNQSTGLGVLRRVDIHDCENGLNVPGNTHVYDSWIHGLIPFSVGGAHSDGAQLNQGAANVRFEHNTIDARGDTTSAIIMWNEGNPQNHDVTITRNLLAGGAYTLYCGRSGVAVNVVIDHNRFVPGAYGYANACDSGGEIWSQNVLDATGLSVPAAQ